MPTMPAPMTVTSLTGASRRRRGSAAGEVRFALFHERPAAFDVVLAREAVGDDFLAKRQVALVRILDVLVDAALRRENRERRVVGEGARVIVDEGFELAGGDHVVDDPEAQRFGRRNAPAGEEHVLRYGRSHELDELPQAIGSIANPELGCRNPEASIFGRDAEV